MTEALKLLIISICLNCGDHSGSPSFEYIRFYSDSLTIGEQRWDIVQTQNLNTYGDKIYNGVFYIKKDNYYGSIKVDGSEVVFTIPKQDITLTLEQMSHPNEFYPPGEL